MVAIAIPCIVGIGKEITGFLRRVAAAMPEPICEKLAQPDLSDRSGLPGAVVEFTPQSCARQRYPSARTADSEGTMRVRSILIKNLAWINDAVWIEYLFHCLHVGNFFLRTGVM
jgi:hypothetical protein